MRFLHCIIVCATIASNVTGSRKAERDFCPTRTPDLDHAGGGMYIAFLQPS